MSWFRVPMWCLGIHSEESAERARAWVYLLGAWAAGDNPSTREIRRVTGFGQGRADRLVVDVAAWAEENGARVPKLNKRQGAEQHRSSIGAEAERANVGQTPETSEHRSSIGAASEQHRSVSRARVPLLEREEREERDLAPPAPAVAAPPPPSPKPIKPPRKPATSTTAAGYHEAIAAWSDEYRTIFGAAYPWAFGVRDGDAPRVKAWISIAQVCADDLDAGIERIRLAARAYLRAVDAHATWPIGEPAQTRHFTRDLAKWLQTDPDAPVAVRSGASRADDRLAAIAALQQAQLRLVES